MRHPGDVAVEEEEVETEEDEDEIMVEVVEVADMEEGTLVIAVITSKRHYNHTQYMAMMAVKYKYTPLTNLAQQYGQTFLEMNKNVSEMNAMNTEMYVK